MSDIHARLKQARLAAKARNSQITQDWVGRHFGITGKAVSGWESRSKPESEKMPKIAEIYGVNLLWLMDGKGPMLSVDPANEFFTNPAKYGVAAATIHNPGETEDVNKPEILQIFEALSPNGQDTLMDEARKLFVKERLTHPLPESRRA